jgi:uncharacterized membrane protein HdeD (DUF308 family)
MHPILRNTLAVLAGIVVGSIVNIGLIQLGTSVIPPPEGGDISTMEGLAATMHLFQPKHFIFPFLAHALGTFAGAWTAARLAASRRLALALLIGVFFLAGGVASVISLPSPVWFTVLDLGLAYIPMGYLAGRLAEKPSPLMADE